MRLEIYGEDWCFVASVAKLSMWSLLLLFPLDLERLELLAACALIKVEMRVV